MPASYTLVQEKSEQNHFMCLRTRDDVMVTSLQVAILDEQRNAVEKGEG